MIVLTVLAVVTRLYWNLVVHPPRNFVYSDMIGYFNRSDDFVKQPLTATYDYLAFFPWGTHAFLGIVRGLFTTPTTCPREVKEAIASPGCSPMDVSLALLGALGVFYVTILARRLTRRAPDGSYSAKGARRWVYVPIGLFTLIYYPLLAQGGYYMSEVPFFACLAAATFHSVRLADEGRTSDAVLFGIFAGLGAFARPQMLMSVALLAVFWFFRRRQLPGASLKKLAIACVPLALLLTFSLIRTTRHARTDNKREIALVSTNDTLNYAFGRCHCISIEARSKGYRAFFGPPSLGSLHFAVKDLKKKKKWVPLELKPAFPDDRNCDLNKKKIEAKQPTEPCIQIEGKMWSRDILSKLAKDCVKKTGYARQAYYALTHIALNFGFNSTWPDSSQKTRTTSLAGLSITTGRPTMEAWQLRFGVGVVPFAVIACFLAFTKRRAREGLLAMHFWASIIVAMIYFGDTRLRTPYDPIFVILAFDLVSRAGLWLYKKTRLKVGV